MIQANIWSVFCGSQISDEVENPAEELDDLSEINDTNQALQEEDDIEASNDELIEQQSTSPVPCPVSRPKIHSRKFRE